MAADNDIVPGLAPVFDAVIERGAPVTVGRLAIGGQRVHVPVTGGKFSGEGVFGKIVGGSETLFDRGNGTSVVEAVYYIENAAGAVARAMGAGYRTDTGDFLGIRMSMLFEADEDGPLSHLADSAFVAEQVKGANLMTIWRIV